MPIKGTPNIEEDSSASWAASLARLPSAVLQPFSLSATALVSAVFLGIFVSPLTCIAALGLSAILLVLGLRATPDEALGQLVAGERFKPVSAMDSDTSIESEAFTRASGDTLTTLEKLCFLHLYVREGGYVGRSRRLSCDYFVDLMSAALVPEHLEILVNEFEGHLRRMGKINTTSVLAGPKRGNALLIAGVARNLGLTPLFIKEVPIFGKFFEGIDGKPACAAVIDDISSDGDLLAHCVRILRSAGYRVNDAYVLIERTDGDSRELLNEMDVQLHPLIQLNDQRLREIAGRARNSFPV